MALQIERGGRDERITLPQRRVCRLPTRAAPHAARALQRREESMAHEGLAFMQGIPVRSWNVENAGNDAEVHVWQGVRDGKKV